MKLSLNKFKIEDLKDSKSLHHVIENNIFVRELSEKIKKYSKVKLSSPGI
jgi:hypothetical protein